MSCTGEVEEPDVKRLKVPARTGCPNSGVLTVVDDPIKTPPPPPPHAVSDKQIAIVLRFLKTCSVNVGFLLNLPLPEIGVVLNYKELQFVLTPLYL